MNHLSNKVGARISVIVGILTWFTMMAILWFVEYKLCNGNLKTNFAAILGITIGYILGYFISEEKVNESETSVEKRKSSKLFHFILLFSVVVFSVYLTVFVNPYLMYPYQFYLLLFLTGTRYVYCNWKKKKRIEKRVSGWQFSILFSAVSCLTIVYCLIVHPITVEDGKHILMKSGYQNVKFEYNIREVEYLNYMFPENEIELQKNEEGLNFYFYRGEKNGKVYGVAVSLVGNRIVGEKNEDNKQ